MHLKVSEALKDLISDFIFAIVLGICDKNSTFCQPALDVILYGSADLSVEKNKQIFLAVQDFILKSKRF